MRWPDNAVAVLLLAVYTYALLFLYERKLHHGAVKKQAVKEPFLPDDRADRVVKALANPVQLDRPARSGNVVRFFTVIDPSTGRVRLYHVGARGLYRTEVRRGTSA